MSYRFSFYQCLPQISSDSTIKSIKALKISSRNMHGAPKIVCWRSRRASYPQFQRSPLGTPGIMTLLLGD